MSLPATSQLQAPAHWRSVDLISDLHLQAQEPETFEAWQTYMDTTPADAVLILGDLFEAWVGDDEVPTSPFLQVCRDALLSASTRLHLGIMHGNRDFLMGPAFMASCGAQLLHDPTVLRWGSHSWLLSHGDALCIDDTAYQKFRQQVRSPTWMASFLAQPLAERQAAARQMRSESQTHQSSSMGHADADTALSLSWLKSAAACHLIHGHTHQAADHVMTEDGQGSSTRSVLSDWDLRTQPPRAQVLRLTADGRQQRLPFAA
jgi:UDP-2,3-diacylglucosamine hydrolase